MERYTEGVADSPTPRLDALQATTEGVWVRLALVDIASELSAGVLLSQLLYWTPRATIERDGYLWIAKTYEDWWDEVRLSERQARRALDLLREQGLVEARRWQFNGTPTTHVRIVPEALEMALDGICGGTSICPPGHLELTPVPLPSDSVGNSFPIPETTAKTTAEIDTEFDTFWSVCPSKKGKGHARNAYKRARAKVSAEVLLAGMERYRDDPNRVPAFTAHPATWLNGERWDDDPLPPRLDHRANFAPKSDRSLPSGAVDRSAL